MVRNNIGACHVNSGRLDAAEAELKAAWALDGQYPIPVFNLAILARARGQDDEAERLRATAARLGYRAATRDRLIAAGGRVLAAIEGRLLEEPPRAEQGLAADEGAWCWGILSCRLGCVGCAREGRPLAAEAQCCADRGVPQIKVVDLSPSSEGWHVESLDPAGSALGRRRSCRWCCLQGTQGGLHGWGCPLVRPPWVAALQRVPPPVSGWRRVDVASCTAVRRGCRRARRRGHGRIRGPKDGHSVTASAT